MFRFAPAARGALRRAAAANREAAGLSVDVGRVERSVFDQSALLDAGLEESGRGVGPGPCAPKTPLVSHLWSHLFANAEFYARHSECADFQLALDVGPPTPGASVLQNKPFGVLSRVVRVAGDADGAKLVLELPDRRRLETAIIVNRRPGRGAPQATICLSSQAGCAMACQFCDTGYLGGGLSLGIPSWAILEQVLHAEAFLQRQDLPRGVEVGARPANIVFMGMGEPLLNYEPVLLASRALCVGRQVTISTVGVATRVAALARAAPQGLRLALSLHAPTQELRSRLLPVAARTWPLPQLMESLRAFEAATGSAVLLEYILLRGVNDGDEHADALAELIQREGLRCAGVNLIPYNTTAAGDAAGFETPSDAHCKSFRARLRNAGVPNVTVRFSTKAGRAVAAACGQLGLGLNAGMLKRSGCGESRQPAAMATACQV